MSTDDGRPLTPAEQADMFDDGGFGFENPLFVAGRFFALVRNRVCLDMAAMLVTPESRHLWSPCFEEEHRLLGLVAGVSDLVDYVAPAVCTVRLPAGVLPGYEYPPGAIRRGLVLTLLYGPDLSSGGWRVHHLGDYVSPDALPVTAPPAFN